jgi:predicted amidohydrolase YtcJ
MIGRMPPADVDLILHGGTVFTNDPGRASASAVAIAGGRIAAVGDDAEIRALAGPRTQDVELRGRMLVPGFQDAHIHASAAGLERLRCDLSELHGVEDYLGAIRAYADANPDVEWILGSGWSLDVFPGGVPTRAALDTAVADRPVMLSNRDHHATWVNARALELAGVTRDTPDPRWGRIERDDAGEPIGTLQESAMDLVDRVVPRPTPDEQRAGILEAQRYLHALGITAWQEAIVGRYAVVPDSFEAYVAAVAAGDLTARVVGALWLERGVPIADQLEGFRERRARAGDGRFRASTVKIMLDGIVESFTAAMLVPYLDGHGGATDDAGFVYFEPDELREAVTALDADGFQAHVHASGDRAVRDALDAVEAARAANGVTDNRHHLAHLQFVHPDDVPRFAALGVVANAQPLWACAEPQVLELTVPYVDPERMGWMYPFGRLVRAGARLAMGSDWSVSSPDPLEEIHVAVNRTMPPGYAYGEPGDDEPLLPEEAVTLAQALEAFTLGSAFVNHLDDETGSVEVGKAADLVVLSEDLLALPPDAVTDATVDLTLVDGAVVFERG